MLSLQKFVCDTIAGGSLGPADPNGVYFLLGDSQTTASSGFCQQYCGWHNAATKCSVNGVPIRYSFVGNAGSQCASGCIAQDMVSGGSPNGNVGVDGMLSVYAHELAEAITDPEISAW